MHMTKVISISDEAYDSLKKTKNKGDSFSSVILKFTKPEKKKNLLEILKEIGPDEELAKNIEEVYRNRKNIKLRRVTF